MGLNEHLRRAFSGGIAAIAIGGTFGLGSRETDLLALPAIVFTAIITARLASIGD